MGWGRFADLDNAPTEYPAHIRSAFFITDRGWELPAILSGNGNPAAQSELIVAMGAPSTGVGVVGEDADDAPAPVYPGGGDVFETLAGISGVALTNPYYFTVVDLEDTVQSGGVTVASSSSLPSGLSISTTGYDYVFQITGTPNVTASTPIGITVQDTNGDTAYFVIPTSITLA